MCHERTSTRKRKKESVDYWCLANPSFQMIKDKRIDTCLIQIAKVLLLYPPGYYSIPRSPCTAPQPPRNPQAFQATMPSPPLTKTSIFPKFILIPPVVFRPFVCQPKSFFLEPSVQRAWNLFPRSKGKESASSLPLAIKICNAVIDRHITIRTQSGEQCLAKHTIQYDTRVWTWGDRTARD